MPAAVAIPLITAAATAGTTLYGAHRASRSNDRASRTQAKAAADALAFEREQEATRRSEFDREQNEMRRQWDTREQNAQPFRTAAASVLARRFGGGAAPGLAGLVAPREFQPQPYQPGKLSDLARTSRY